MLELNKIINGHVLNVLKQLPSESINMCVTSPPYWGLRNYNTDGQIWGGNSNCEHEWDTFTRQGISDGTKSEKVQIKGKDNFQIVKPTEQAFCIKCGAWFGELGLEPTPELYVEHLVEIFREVKRVLKDDGTLWLNLGDCYAGNRGNSSKSPGFDNKAAQGHAELNYNYNRLVSGLKAKDLVGIPWLTAFGLRGDGWYLRSDVIWEKPNVMPESVRDRPTKSHEYIFLFSKNNKYYYDKDSIKEPYTESSIKRINQKSFDEQKGGEKDYGKTNVNKNRSARNTIENFKKNLNKNGGRNKRTVWSINTKPFKEAHFAVFPPDLIKPCILAGCPEGGVVIDPFIGSGTTGMVAKELNRNYIGIELNPTYSEMAEKRIENT